VCLQHQFWTLSLINFKKAMVIVIYRFKIIWSAVIWFGPYTTGLEFVWFERDSCRHDAGFSSDVTIDQRYATSIVALHKDWFVLWTEVLIYLYKVLLWCYWLIVFEEHRSVVLLQLKPFLVYVWYLLHDFVF